MMASVATTAGPADLPRAERRRRGAWATPTWLVERVLDLVLDPVLAARGHASELRVLDPACGDGRFLAAAGHRIQRRFGLTAEQASACLFGIELDPSAAAAARDRLGPGTSVQTGDALSESVDAGPDRGPRRGFDVVVGNPPYLNQLAAATTRGGRSRHGGGPYADAAAEFLALALREASPRGGRVGLVLPQSLLATRDAAPIRATALAQARLDGLWWAGTRVFDAAVHTIVATFVRGEPQREVRRWRGTDFEALRTAPGADLFTRPTWSHLVADAAGIPPVSLATEERVGDHASATAGFRDQFYGLIPYITDGPTEAPLVTAGLLDPGHCAWGDRPARFAGRRLDRPGVDLHALVRENPRLAAWVAARRVPKVLVATQTTVLEAAADPSGGWVPSVPVVSVEPPPGTSPPDLWALAAVLGSPAASAWAAATYLGAGLGATALKLSASQVLTIPWPGATLGAAATRLQVGDIAGSARAALDAYRLAAEERDAVWEWWQERVSATRRRRAPTTGC